MSTKRIGEILKETWQSSGLSQKEFADRMDMSVRNLQYLFEKNDIHISQLAKASSVLKTDFIKLYLEIESEKSGIQYPTEYNQDKLVLEEVLEKYTPQNIAPKNEVNLQINVKADFELMYKHFPDFLNLVKNEAEKIGFKLS